jgi:hypothetical protein
LIPSALVADGEGPDAAQTPVEASKQVAPAAGITAVAGHAQPTLSLAGNGAGPSRRTSAGLLVRPEDQRGAVDLPQRGSIEPAARASEPVAVEPASAEPAVTVEPTVAIEPMRLGGQTRNGLPLRVRQANLAAALKQEAVEAPLSPEGEGHKRAPEDVRRALSSYQQETRRGRADAQRPLQADSGATPYKPVGHVSPVDSAAGEQLAARATPGEYPGDVQEEDR